MARGIPALVQPTLLVWARQQSGYPPEPVAKRLHVKPERLLAWDGYQRWKSAWAKYLATLKSRLGGFASPVDKALSRAVRPLAQLVIEALDSNRITAVQACWYLDLRFQHFDKLRSELRYGSRSAQTEDDGE